MSEAACLHSDSDSHCSPKPWITYESQSHPVLLRSAVYTLMGDSFNHHISLLNHSLAVNLTFTEHSVFILIVKD